MKKVFLSCTTVLLMGAAAVYGHKAFMPQTELSPIQLENAEAIANNEAPKLPCIIRDGTCTFESSLEDGTPANVTLSGVVNSES